MCVIQLSDIWFRRGARDILRGVSWRIERGCHWALLGPNGSGKTTLLKIITGYEWATSGSVHVLGKRFGACNLPELRRAIGWVSSALEHELPARDAALDVVISGLDASIGLYRLATPADDARAHAALRLLGIDALADQPYGRLSQGEKQRVLIARALVPEPAVLILDEPCVGLDPAARHEFLRDLAQLSQSPAAPTMILVTHHVEEIGPWVDRVMVLKEGTVLAAGPPRETLTAAVLGEAFGVECRVDFDGIRHWMRIVDEDM